MPSFFFLLDIVIKLALFLVSWSPCFSFSLRAGTSRQSAAICYGGKDPLLIWYLLKGWVVCKISLALCHSGSFFTSGPKAISFSTMEGPWSLNFLLLPFSAWKSAQTHLSARLSCLDNWPTQYCIESSNHFPYSLSNLWSAFQVLPWQPYWKCAEAWQNSPDIQPTIVYLHFLLASH